MFKTVLINLKTKYKTTKTENLALTTEEG